MNQQIQDLIAKAETGEDWAEICRLEAEILGTTRFEENECGNDYVSDNGQFGMGA